MRYRNAIRSVERNGTVPSHPTLMPSKLTITSPWKARELQILFQLHKHWINQPQFKMIIQSKKPQNILQVGNNQTDKRPNKYACTFIGRITSYNVQIATHITTWYLFSGPIYSQHSIKLTSLSSFSDEHQILPCLPPSTFAAFASRL